MRSLSEADAVGILKASRLGTLALAHDDNAYAVPLFYGYDGEAIYFHCHPGVKDEWIAATKEACLLVTHIETEDIWESVQVFGTLEKVSLSTDIQSAKNALYQVPFPPAEGEMPGGRPLRTDQKVYYLKLTPREIDGKSSSFKE